MSQLNRNSGSYIFMYAILMTLILGSVLAFTSESLKEKQASQREFERKKFILSAALGADEIAAMIEKDKKSVEALYEARVKDYVVNADGDKIDGLSATDIVVSKEYKLAKEERKLPVYTIASESGDEVQYYVFPIYGYGLWDNIFGYMSLQKDLNTIQGVIFDHVGETPGLGARITEDEVQKRYIGKQIKDQSGTIVGVNMQKGEGADYNGDTHKVNGMTGATITGNGVNDMVKNYMTLYQDYFKKIK